MNSLISSLCWLLFITKTTAQVATVSVYGNYGDGISSCADEAFIVPNVGRDTCRQVKNGTLSFGVDVFDKSSCLVKIWENGLDCTGKGYAYQVPIGPASSCQFYPQLGYGFVASCSPVDGDEKDTRLSTLTVSDCQLSPPFNPYIHEYSCTTKDYSTPIVSIQAVPVSTATSCNLGLTNSTTNSTKDSLSCAGSPQVPLTSPGHSVEYSIVVSSPMGMSEEYVITVTRAVSPSCSKDCSSCTKSLDFYYDQTVEYSSLTQCPENLCLQLGYYHFVAKEPVIIYVSPGKTATPDTLVNGPCGEGIANFRYSSGSYFFRFHCPNWQENCLMKYQLQWKCVPCGLSLFAIIDTSFALGDAQQSVESGSQSETLWSRLQQLWKIVVFRTKLAIEG